MLVQLQCSEGQGGPVWRRSTTRGLRRTRVTRVRKALALQIEARVGVENADGLKGAVAELKVDAVRRQATDLVRLQSLESKRAMV